ncbi:MAG: magnesium transporter, partial [Phycisphaerales bacterium]
YDYSMLPVIDLDDRLIGIVTVDDVIDIIRAEQTEDVQKTVGAGAQEAVYSGVMEKFRGRFPWLMVSLVMMVPTAWIILGFEDLIRQAPILAMLMPVIAAIVGNAGHQALAVTQRGLVLEEVRRERILPLLVREWTVGLMTGFVLGAIILLGVGLLSLGSTSASWLLGAVTGVGTMVAMSVGTLFGSLIPMLMKRLGFDPAQSSAIFLIMITDAVSFGIILSLSFSTYEKILAPGS